MQKIANLSSVAFVALILMLAVEKPVSASSFSAIVQTSAVDQCNTSIASGGISGGSGFAAAISPQTIITGQCNNQLIDASAYAFADVASGQLRVSAQSSANTYTYANAIISDLITVIPTNGFLDSYFPVTVTMQIDGSLSGNAMAAGRLQLGSVLQSVDVSPLALCSSSSCDPSTSNKVSPGAQTEIITGIVNVSTNNPLLFIQSFLNATANDPGGSADFSHTAQLSMVLPTGFSFTSDSGVFLSQAPVPPGPTSSVPEPSSILLLGAGMLGLAVIRRHRFCKK